MLRGFKLAKPCEKDQTMAVLSAQRALLCTIDMTSLASLQHPQHNTTILALEEQRSTWRELR